MSGQVAMRQVTVEKLFDANRERLQLTWLANRQGGSRVLTGENALKPTMGQVGHMNFIHPFRIQILGAAEVAFLRDLPEDELQRLINRLFTTELVAMPTRTLRSVPRSCPTLRTVSTMLRPARTARSAASSWACGYPK